MTRFALAPMSRLILGLTVVLLAIPILFLAIGVAGAALAHRTLGGIGLLLVLLYAAVWLLWRPTAFEVDSRRLSLVFPLRRSEVPRDDVSTATVMDRGTFCARYGFAMRVGVGGLWGGFGWLWTWRRGFVAMYVSRTDGVVLVERRRGRDLVITPDRPVEFITALTTR